MATQAPDLRLARLLAKVSACLEGFTLPTGTFHSHGAWEHCYAIWVMLPPQSGGKSHQVGALRVCRRPLAEGSFQLEVNQAARQAGGWSVHCIDARIICANDRLSTPKRWELRTVILDRKNQPLEGTEVREVGEVDGKVIRRWLFRRGDKVERTMPVPKAFTSNWSLFDALQRLVGSEIKSLSFDLLEEMELLKPNQRLSYCQSIKVELGGQSVRLHEFVQIGEGILPHHYWLDEERRLLVAIGGMRAFVFDPSAQLPEVSQ